MNPAEVPAEGGSHHADAAEQLRRDVVEDRLELPLLPNVAAEVLASSVDERADASRLAALIQQDQSLASHVLRIVNSPAFRGAAEIVALQQAIARLGMTRIREIALSASLKGTLLGDGAYQSHAAAAWRTSLAAGLWAKEVARAVRRNVEIAYLCGLLHRIGAPVLLHRLGSLGLALDDAAVAAVLGELATPAGIRLAQVWQLPEPVCAAIAHLDDPRAAPAHAEAVAVAACGVELARRDLDGAIDLDGLSHHPAVTDLNLYPEDLEALVERREHIRLALESMVT